ncbi:uncharacterized protein LOC127790427 isoform X1 [Diospyros lotus]|uniref:uncharacterized protein LOC127790427 isoform X1 n=1 Tax=Diospyros lotus TaxID=55363 RepID=UPI002259A855|nr:uncharacterized protein LOC127790427 isoform X1 [Diospyros lotus]
MAKTDETTVVNREPETPWGTWEELLLACAVHRYGTNSWDSVAGEVQRRSSASAVLSPDHCKKKYQDLKRRFSHQNGTVSPRDGDDNKADAVPWLDELRKLRVAELRRELERCDLSIVSLQLKVKRLNEEREESLRKGDNGGEKSDLDKNVHRKRDEEEKREQRGEPDKLSPRSVAGDPVAGNESNRENQSVSESNSTDPKGETYKTGDDGKEPEPIRTGERKPEAQDLAGGSTKPVGENSCNGSSDSIEKMPVRESVKAEPDRGARDSAELWESVAELWESVAESKDGHAGDEATAKESSDVQSSASKSRKEGVSDKLRSGCISGDEPENDDQSPAMKVISVKSQPLVDILEIVRSHRLGSVFERRLESQVASRCWLQLLWTYINHSFLFQNVGEYRGKKDEEKKLKKKKLRNQCGQGASYCLTSHLKETPEYKNLIRQHMDLETIRMRIEEGCYSGCNKKFFRDMLLLFNNAIIFFGKKSRESVAAIELRQLISKEMIQRTPKLELSAGEQTSLPPLPLSSKPDPEPSDSLLLKPKISNPIIVCRKRSSIAKASGSSLGAADRKREQKAALLEEKPILDWKQPSKTSKNTEENRVTKKRTRDRFASGPGSSKKNGGKNQANPEKNSENVSSQNQGKGGSSTERSEAKSERNTTTVAGAKKRSAANFLNRMKRGSSTNNGSLLDTLKTSAISSNNSRGGGAGDQKASSNGKGNGKKEQASRRAAGGRQVKEQESPAKRSVGRPPKRAAAPPHPQPGVAGKRGREGGDAETSASRQPKKRSRK